ncbi:hypothetical protein [Ferribacterium limneticum]|uniref:hypothetical protein n=1 Tax=Ferribacterium limneticum TaxID=76259 RepID=UPI001CF7F668|nr:hypothetical protein [Ferribacterium limneticum]UCV26688.1 hypothetical protein KI617_10230 [Ferribacterium limneticum]UCV30605.1 hypothetical protein KI608_10230 [Ferribacterium limneticum]
MLDKQPNKSSTGEAVSQELPEPTESKRRRVLTSAISASALIVTAANQPAWAGDRCTRSALNSANLSGRQTFLGCGRSAGKWKTHPELWPSDCSSGQAFTGIFGSWKYKSTTASLFAGKTLGDVIQLDGASDSNPGNIAMHVVGAYVNAHAFPKSSPSGKGYTYSPTDVVNMFKNAAAISCFERTPDALARLKDTFDAANNLYDGTTDWP